MHAMNSDAVDECRRPPQPRGVTHLDAFMALNGTILGVGTLYAYAVAEWEFGLYAAVLLALGALAWRALRRYEYPWWLLGLLQLAVLAHFAGGFVRLPPDSHTLYWHHVAGIRVDRIVHFFNAGIGSVAVMHLYRQAGLRLGHMRGFVVVATVSALGVGVEIMEYFAATALPQTGVGDYANTLQDLIVNTIGAIAGYSAARGVESLRSRLTDRDGAGPSPT